MDGQARVNVYLELKNKLKSGLDQAKQYLNKNVQDMKGKLNELKAHHIESFRAMQEEIPGFGRAMQVLGNPYVLMTAGAVGLMAALGKAGGFAADFDEALAKANVTAQKSPAELQKIKDQLLGIASNSNVKDAVMKAPEAYNILLSSGMNEKTAMATVDPTLKASKAGRTDIKTTADALSNTMNSTGITDANRVLDVLFATLKGGKAEFVDIANYLPKIIPGADAVGASFEQTAGSFAFLTANGLKAEAASVGLQNVFKAFKDTKIKDNFTEMGISIFDANGKFRGMTDIVGDLKKKLGGMSDEQRAAKLDALGLDVEASTSLGIMVKNYETLDPMIKSVTNSTGEFNKAQEYGATKMDSWNLLVNNAQIYWLKLGDIALNGFASVVNWFIANGGTFKTILEDIGIVIATIAIAYTAYNTALAVAAIATNGLSFSTGILAGIQSVWGLVTATATTYMWSLNAAMAANPVGFIIAGIIALIGGLVLAYKHFDTFRAMLTGLMAVASLVADVFVGLGKTIMGAFTLDMGMIKAGMIQSATAVTEIINGGIKKKYQEAYDSSMAESAVKNAKEKVKPEAANNLLAGNKPPVLNNNNTTNTKQDKKANRETGMSGGSQTKVITINKVSMIDGNFISSNPEFAGMDKAAMQKFMEELFQRMMINLGRSYS